MRYKGSEEYKLNQSLVSRGLVPKSSTKGAIRMRNMRQKILKILGNKCVECGTRKDLQIDHKNGRGAEDRSQFSKRYKTTHGSSIGTGYGFYKTYTEDPDLTLENLQILCRYHNSKKAILNKESGRIITEKRFCLLCGSNKTLFKKYKSKILNEYRYTALWLKYKNGFICRTCFGKEYRRKKRLNST